MSQKASNAPRAQRVRAENSFSRREGVGFGSFMALVDMWQEL